MAKTLSPDKTNAQQQASDNKKVAKQEAKREAKQKRQLNAAKQNIKKATKKLGKAQDTLATLQTRLAKLQKKFNVQPVTDDEGTSPQADVAAIEALHQSSLAPAEGESNNDTRTATITVVPVAGQLVPQPAEGGSDLSQATVSTDASPASTSGADLSSKTTPHKEDSDETDSSEDETTDIDENGEESTQHRQINRRRTHGSHATH